LAISTAFFYSVVYLDIKPMGDTDLSSSPFNRLKLSMFLLVFLELLFCEKNH